MFFSPSRVGEPTRGQYNYPLQQLHWPPDACLHMGTQGHPDLSSMQLEKYREVDIDNVVNKSSSLCRFLWRLLEYPECSSFGPSLLRSPPSLDWFSQFTVRRRCYSGSLPVISAHEPYFTNHARFLPVKSSVISFIHTTHGDLGLLLRKRGPRTRARTRSPNWPHLIALTTSPA